MIPPVQNNAISNSNSAHTIPIKSTGPSPPQQTQFQPLTPPITKPTQAAVQPLLPVINIPVMSQEATLKRRREEEEHIELKRNFQRSQEKNISLEQENSKIRGHIEKLSKEKNEFEAELIKAQESGKKAIMDLERKLDIQNTHFMNIQETRDRKHREELEAIGSQLQNTIDTNTLLREHINIINRDAKIEQEYSAGVIDYYTKIVQKIRVYVNMSNQGNSRVLDILTPPENMLQTRQQTNSENLNQLEQGALPVLTNQYEGEMMDMQENQVAQPWDYGNPNDVSLLEHQ
jgi:hypothetical protein